MLISWFERTPGHDVDLDPQEFLEVLEQPDVIEKRGAWLEVHEQIEVAVRTSLAPGDGAEHGDALRATFPRDAQNLRPASAQSLQRQHLIRHDSSVSPHPGAELDQRATWAERHLSPRGELSEAPRNAEWFPGWAVSSERPR